MSSHKLSRFLLSILLSVALLSGCATSPTGRSQLIMVSEASMSQMGASAFAQMRQDQPISYDGKTNGYVTCVANAITRQLPAQFAGLDWEVVVFEDEAANAFALPGGKIGVYTGMLDVAENQGQLATVVGHEVAHVVARHGAERYSQQLAATGASTAAAVAVGSNASSTERVAIAALGIGITYGILMPYSRTQESEADQLGLDYMAAAGFDPTQSVILWRNMSSAGGSQPPEFLSTHPSHKTRIRDLQDWMGRAQRAENQAHLAGRNPNCQGGQS